MKADITYYVYRLTGLSVGEKYTISRGNAKSGTNMLFGISVNQASYNNAKFMIYDGLNETFNNKYITWTQETGDYVDILFSYKSSSDQTTQEKLTELFQRILYVQLEKDSVVTAYEPYTGGKPSPSPEYPQEIKSVGKWNELTRKYDVDVIVSGRNIFDMSSALKANGKLDSDTSKAIEIKPFKIVKGMKYVLVTKGVTTNDVYSSIYFGEDTLSYGKEDSKILTTPIGYFAFKDGIRKTCILTAGKSTIVTRMMVHGNRKIEDEYSSIEELGVFPYSNDENISNIYYEPYCQEPKELTISLDQPLRGIGDYKDEVTKDGIVRNIHRFEYDGSENWVLHNNTSKEKTQAFGINISTMCKGVNLGGICNRLLPRYIAWMGDNEGFDIYANNTLYINLEKTKASNIEEFKTWLSQNQVTVDAILEKPFIEPLPEDFKRAVESLKTYYPSTVITVDGGEVDPDVEVTYIADTKNYIDQKIENTNKSVIATQKALL